MFINANKQSFINLNKQNNVVPVRMTFKYSSGSPGFYFKPLELSLVSQEGLLSLLRSPYATRAALSLPKKLNNACGQQCLILCPGA